MKLSSKRIIATILTLALTISLFTGMPIGIGAVTYGDFEYEFDPTTLEATITGYTGTGENVVIPDTIDVNEYKVTAIGAPAFAQNTSIKSVDISDNVTAIGDSAFSGCSGLTTITLSDNLETIGTDAFSGCSGLTTITIPGTVSSIGDNAFDNCSGLTEIVVNAANLTYKSVDGVLFNYAGTTLIKYPMAKAGETYTVPAGVTEIGKYAFAGSINIKSIVLPESVIKIADHAYTGCLIKFIKIPSAVTTIGDNAFSSCNNLVEAKFTGNAPGTFGNDVFSGCAVTFTIYYSPESTGWTSPVWNGYAAYEYDAGFSYEYDEGTLEATITGYTGSNSDIVIPDTIDGHKVTAIGASAFSGCSGLTTITIPGAVSSIGDNAFNECSGLTGIVVNAANSAYKSVDGVLFNYAGTTLIKYPMAKAGETYTVPSGVTEIGYQAFYGCKNITGVTVSSGVNSIGDRAFAYCTSLTQINVASGNTVFESVDSVLFNEEKTFLIQYPAGKTGETYAVPDDVTEIGKYAFAGSINIKSIVLPESVIKIADHAFTGCLIKFIKIPSAVTNIGDNAFSSCSNLAGAKFMGNAPGTFGNDVFSGCAVTFTIYYSPGSTGWTSPEWNGYAAYEYDPGFICVYDPTTLEATITGYTGTKIDIVIPDTIDGYKVTAIGASAFAQMTSITSIVISNNVTVIGDSAFSGCSGLTTITIPGAVSSIGDNAFNECSGLTEIVVNAANSAYKSVDGVLFNYAGTTLIKYPMAKAGETYTIPDGVTEIGKYAFAGCLITYIKIPSAVTNIGDNAFSSCSNLFEAKFMGNAPDTFGSNVFSGCAVTFTIYYMPGSTGWTSPEWNGYAAYEFDPGFSYEYDPTTLEATITGYTGTKSAIVIPDTIDGYKVTAIGASAFAQITSITSIVISDNVTVIGNSAFSGCSGLTTITIPGTVSLIGDNAFDECSGLTEIVVNAANSAYKSVDGVLFNYAGTTLIKYPMAKADATYTVPAGVTEIGYQAFYGCKNLTGVTVSSEVNLIGDRAFAYCTSLTQINVDSGNMVYESVDGVLFNEAKTLLIQYPAGKTGETYTIPDGVTEIGKYAFAGCLIKYITIPSAVTNIGDYAFSNCKNLLEAKFAGNAPDTFGSNVFSGCAAAFTIYYPEGSTGWTSPEWNGYAAKEYDPYFLYEYDTTTLEVTITGYTGTKGDIVIPDTIDTHKVTAIGASAFARITSIASVVMSDNVNVIGDSAFSGCSGLTTITLSKNLTTIGKDAFSGCSGLTTITIPGAVSSIGDNAFNECSGLTEIVVDSANITYKSVDGVLLNKAGTTLIKYPMAKADQTYTVPTGVTEIGYKAFYGCMNITGVTVSSGVNLIGDGAFTYCTSLTQINTASGNTVFESVDGVLFNEAKTLLIQYPAGKTGDTYTVPDGVTEIGKYAFGGSMNVTSIIISESVTIIADHAFTGCLITFVKIPSAVTNIGDNAFSSCNNLLEAKFAGNAPGTFGSNVFSGCDVTFTIYYMPGSTGWTSPEWNGYPTYEFDTGLVYEYDTTTLEVTITGYTGTKSSVIVPRTIDGHKVTSIGASAFYQNTTITNVEIWDNVAVIGDSAFSGCSEITEITLSKNLLNIGKYSFLGCKGLTTITIPAAVISIEQTALNGCSALTEIVVDAANITYKSVDGVLFNYEGTKLIKYPVAKADETYTVPDGVTEIGYQAFNSCKSITGVTVSADVTTIGDSAFLYCYMLETVSLPAAVTSIGNMAFTYCTSLTQINVDSGNTAYESVDGVLYNEAKTKLIQYACGKTGTTYTIPNTVNEIGNYAFAGSISLTSIRIPESVIYIDDYAFATCVMLTKIYLLENLTTIGPNAFTGCSSITEIQIPSTVVSIGDYAFNYCSSMTKAKFKGAAPGTFGSNVFNNCADSFIIYYPVGSTGWTSPEWKGYATKAYDPDVLAGADRYDTSVQISEKSYNSSDTALLALGTNFPDALSGGALAYQMNAPILLTQKAALPASTKNELIRLGVTKVTILGGEAVVNASVVTELETMGITVNRISGSTRYATAVAVADSVRDYSGVLDTVVLASGENFPDAISMGSYAAKSGIPILLTQKAALSADTAAALEAFGIKNVIIAGGTAVISEAVIDEIKAMGIAITNIAGSDRYSTGTAAANKYFGGATNGVIACGTNFPDALSVVPYAAKLNAPILLVKPTRVPDSVSAFVSASAITNLVYTGGDAVVGPEVRTALEGLIK